MQFITKIVNSVFLNILWFICSIPIFTIGASTTALYYVTLKMAKNEEGNIAKSFFRSFKENFKQSTIIWMILFVIGCALALDGYIFYHMHFENVLWTIGTAVFFVAVAAYVVVLLYIFPLLARFDNTTAAMFKNAIALGIRFLLCTVLIVVIHAMMAYVVVFIFTPAIIFGEGLCAFLSSIFLANIMIQCEDKSEEHLQAGE